MARHINLKNSKEYEYCIAAWPSFCNGTMYSFRELSKDIKACTTGVREHVNIEAMRTSLAVGINKGYALMDVSAGKLMRKSFKNKRDGYIRQYNTGRIYNYTVGNRDAWSVWGMHYTQNIYGLKAIRKRWLHVDEAAYITSFKNEREIALDVDSVTTRRGMLNIIKNGIKVIDDKGCVHFKRGDSLENAVISSNYGIPVPGYKCNSYSPMIGSLTPSQSLTNKGRILPPTVLHYYTLQTIQISTASPMVALTYIRPVIIHYAGWSSKTDKTVTTDKFGNLRHTNTLALENLIDLDYETRIRFFLSSVMLRLDGKGSNVRCIWICNNVDSNNTHTNLTTGHLISDFLNKQLEGVDYITTMSGIKLYFKVVPMSLPNTIHSGRLTVVALIALDPIKEELVYEQ
jgi:hypothetical protein